MRDLPVVPGVEHEFVETSRLRMHVARSGSSGPALVLLHGWPQHWFEYRHVIAPLAERYSVICPDLRGLGWTEAPARGYDKESIATDVLALLDALDLERVFLVGHDWGAHAGFLLCLREPNRVERFVALNQIHPWIRFSPSDLLHFWRLAYQYLLAFPVLGARVLRHWPGFVRGRIRAWSARDVWSAAELDAFTEPLREPERARASAQYYRTFVLGELFQMLAGRYRNSRLLTPTLLLFGEDDGVIRPHQVRGFEPYADDMRLELIPGVGHFPEEEAPELVVERTLEHFAVSGRA
jgi:pimeloyl-ACP methyl ester carboxylesterase